MRGDFRRASGPRLPRQSGLSPVDEPRERRGCEGPSECAINTIAVRWHCVYSVYMTIQSAPLRGGVGERSDLLTTGEVAALLGVTRQHVVNLCTRGELPFELVSTHRRVRREDLEEFVSSTRGATKDQRRSLWLGYALAGQVAVDPERALSVARRSLDLMRSSASPRTGRVWFDAWQAILDRGPSAVMSTLTSDTLRARELRQHAPFAGLLSDDQRGAALGAFQTFDRRRPSR